MPGEDGMVGTPDDVHAVNDLHVPVNEEIVLSIKSQDVLHSFFLPNLRVKQDVVPGMKQFRLVPGQARPACTTSSAPSCAAGGITR